MARPAVDEEPTAPQPQPVTTRAPLGGRLVLGSRTAANQQAATQSLSLRTPGGSGVPKTNAGKINVFVDSGSPHNDDAQTNQWSHLQSHAELVKENKTPGSSAGIHQGRVAPRTPKVSIYRDEVSREFDCVQSHQLIRSIKSATPGPLSQPGTPERIFLPRVPDGTQELSKDPFMNYPKHLKFEVDLPDEEEKSNGQTPRPPPPAASSSFQPASTSRPSSSNAALVFVVGLELNLTAVDRRLPLVLRRPATASPLRGATSSKS